MWTHVEMALQGQHRRCSRTAQCGQIAPTALFGILIASAVLALMFSSSQQITARSQVANAADAAAYSGAVWTARHLNFMAYANRAMVANHAAVGHFVSYVSWIRYVDDSIQYIDRVAQWIPYVGQYVDIVEQIASEVRSTTEAAARIAIPAIDGWNATFRAAQTEAQASLVPDRLQELMARTAAAYDPGIRINDEQDLEHLPPDLRTVLELQLAEQLAAIPGFVRRYVAGNDRNSVSELIQASVQSNSDIRHWIGGTRGWREDLLAAQLRKRGSSTANQGSSTADWTASDDLQHRKRDLTGWAGWRRVGDKTSTASAREFAENYSGVPRYYNLAGAPGDRALQVIALATLRQENLAGVRLPGATASRHPIAVAALARIEFSRPSGGLFATLAGDRHEYSNLFNPFWEAHLAPLGPRFGAQN